MVYRLRNLILIMTLCVTLLSLLGAPLYAQEDTGIVLHIVDEENMPISDAVFRIYKFASATESENGYEFNWDGEYDSNGMNINKLSDAYLPVHLAVFVQERGLTYTQAATDSDGKVVFDELLPGAYLIVPVSLKQGYLTPAPFVVTLPMWNSSSESWSFYVDASPKVEAEREESEKTYISVKKEWHGFDKHPDSVKVVLVKDSEITEEVTLSADNNWQYRWNDLDKSHSWSVIEVDVPKGYEVDYDISQMTVTVKNVYMKTEEDIPQTPSDDSPKDTTPKDQLIQTGQLRWPIPVLAIAGLLIFSLGWSIVFIGKERA